MKSVEDSGLSFGISRLLSACAEQNGLAAAAAAIVNPSHLQFTNSSTHPSLLQHAHHTFNQSMDIENNSNHSKSSINGETKLPNNENTLNLMNSFTHYNNLASIANPNGSFLKTSIDTQLKVNNHSGTNGLNGLINNTSPALNVAAVTACNNLPCIPPRRIGHPYQNRTPPKRKKPRTSFNRSQIHELEKRFQKQKYLASTDRANLAKDLGMSDAQVKTWFQNRRTKWRQNAEEREAERQAANRLLLSLQTGEHQIKSLGTHSALAAAASLAAHQTAAGLFNSTVPHPINLLNNGPIQTSHHHLLSPKSTTSNSSTSRDQVHELDLNESNQTVQRHLNQLMQHHHQLHPFLSSNTNLTTTSTPSSTTSASSTTPPSQLAAIHPSSSSFNTATSLTAATNTPNSSTSIHDFHQNSLAALNTPGHLLNRHFSQLSHFHRLGSHYPISLNGQSNLGPTSNQSSLISHLQSNNQLTDHHSTASSTSSNTLTTNSPSNAAAHLYNINQLSQLSHYAQLGFLAAGNSSMLNSLQMNVQQHQQINEQDEKSGLEHNKKKLSESDEETACFTEDECDQEDNMEINVASDDEDCKTETDEKEIKIEKLDNLDKNSKFNKKKVTKKLKIKEEEEINIDENSKESDHKIDELLRNKDERRKIKLKPYKLISSNSIVGSA